MKQNFYQHSFFFSKRKMTTTVSSSQITAILISIFLLVILGLFFFHKLSINLTLGSMVVLVFISIIILSLVTGPSSLEKFFFEVSPEKEQCLLQQVQLTHNRCPGCCDIGTVGGTLPVYTEWTTPNEYSGNWIRTDNLTMNVNNTPLKTQIPPTELVPKEHPLFKKRSQVDLYNQRF